MSSLPTPSFIRFCIVGGIGFIVDFLILYSLIYFFELGPIQARAISFVFAITTTWLLNRRYLFPDIYTENKFHEWIRYISTHTTGGAINFLMYSALVLYAAKPFDHIFIALLISNLVSLNFNYFGSKIFVFKK